jgi:hypothetical protein
LHRGAQRAADPLAPRAGPREGGGHAVIQLGVSLYPNRKEGVVEAREVAIEAGSIDGGVPLQGGEGERCIAALGDQVKKRGADAGALGARIGGSQGRHLGAPGAAEPQGLQASLATSAARRSPR